MTRWKEAAEKYEYDLPLEDEGCQLYTARQIREAFQHAAAEGYAAALEEAASYFMAPDNRDVSALLTCAQVANFIRALAGKEKKE